MTKHEFMTRLINELHRRNVADAADIAEEYEQHFAFKLADGYSEEEIAAKLGAPEELAAQFGEVDVPKRAGHSAALTWLWLGWVDLFFGLFTVLLLAFGVVLAACVLSFGLTGVCLAGHISRFPLVTLPLMPYSSAFLFGVALLALTVACVIGCIWFFAFIRQLFRAYERFHQNTLAAAKGEAALPQLPIHPQFAPARRRRMRTVLIVSVVSFGVAFVLGLVLSMILAGAPEFWHVWGWFGYGA